jgi:hypothetical protein
MGGRRDDDIIAVDDDPTRFAVAKRIVDFRATPCRSIGSPYRCLDRRT